MLQNSQWFLQIPPKGRIKTSWAMDKWVHLCQPECLMFTWVFFNKNINGSFNIYSPQATLKVKSVNPCRSNRSCYPTFSLNISGSWSCGRHPIAKEFFSVTRRDLPWSLEHAPSLGKQCFSPWWPDAAFSSTDQPFMTRRG